MSMSKEEIENLMTEINAKKEQDAKDIAKYDEEHPDELGFFDEGGLGDEMAEYDNNARLYNEHIQNGTTGLINGMTMDEFKNLRGGINEDGTLTDWFGGDLNEGFSASQLSDIVEGFMKSEEAKKNQDKYDEDGLLKMHDDPFE